MLPAGAAGAKRVDAQIGRVQLDFFQFIGFGHHRHGAGRSVDAALAFGGRHALHAVAARFEFELAVGAQPDNAGNHFFIAAQIAFVGRHDFHLPTVALGKAAIHAQQITGKQGRFVAAGAGAHFDKDVFIVIGIFRQKQGLQFVAQRFDLRLRRFDFFSGKVFHFRVGQHFLRLGQIALRLPVALKSFHHRRDFRMLARELAIIIHIGGGLGRAEQMGHFFKALGQLLQFFQNRRLHNGAFHNIDNKMRHFTRAGHLLL